jgi:serine/threonine protein kinase
MLSMPSPLPSLSLPSGRALSQTPTSLSFSNQPSSRPWLAAGVELTAAGYDAERRRRVLYTHPPLHVVMIQLILSLLLHPGGERLDAALVERGPDPTRSPGTELPLPLLLLSHLSHAANAPVLPPLVAAVRAMGDAPLLLLRLLAPPLFPSSRYRLGTALSRGSFGSVWSCGVEPRLEGAPPLAVKLIEVRQSRFRRSNLVEVFAEAYALWTLRGASFVTELYDVGTDGSSYWFVMRRYACTLADWANGHPAKLPSQEPQRPIGIRRATSELLGACAHVLSAVRMLHERGVHHYDLKLANILCLERGEDRNGGGELTGGLCCIRSGGDGQVTKLALADFGVATCVTRAESSEPPVRSRGTECIQSPEMLLVSKTAAPPSLEHALLAPDLLAPGPLAPRGEGGDSTKGAWVPVGTATRSRIAIHTESPFTPTATRSRIAGERCDVWSLGCLFYELLAGESLFGTEPWSAFFHRLTDASQPLLAPHKIERLPAPHAPAICAFLSAVLQRQAERRPCLTEVCALLAELRATIAASDPADASSVALDDGPCASVATVPSPPPWVPTPPSSDLERRLERVGVLPEGAQDGAAQLSEDLMIAPLRLLHATSSWHALGVGQVVSCCAQPTHKGEASRDPLSCVNLESGASLEAAVAIVSRLMDRASAPARTTLLVFDDRDASGGYAMALAAALLERREGLSAFDAFIRLRQVCPHMHE